MFIQSQRAGGMDGMCIAYCMEQAGFGYPLLYSTMVY